MYSLTIDPAVLASALVFAKEDRRRPYLHAVQVELSPTHALVAATNGAALLVQRVDYIEGDERPAQPFSALVNAADALAAVKLAGRLFITLRFGDERALTIATAGGQLSVQTRDDRYPDWRRAIPARADGTPAQFDPALIADFAKVLKLHGRKRLHFTIRHNGQAGAWVDLRTINAFGVLMPLRGMESDLSRAHIDALIDGATGQPAEAETEEPAEAIAA